MTTNQISFDDGAGYERFMGEWSQLAGLQFIDWLAPARGLRWLDVGCGNGAFTDLIMQRCTPSAVLGIDPSKAQLEFARKRLVAPNVEFRTGDAMALPSGDDAFDAAVMPLVIFFVSDPATGVAEMVRVVAPGGVVAAYAWDMPGGGFPYATVNSAMRSLGIDVPSAPSPDASRLDVLHQLWTEAGLEEVETRTITVSRTFRDFDDYWNVLLTGPSIGRTLTSLGARECDELRQMIREGLSSSDPEHHRDPARGLTTSARANAIRGRVARVP